MNQASIDVADQVTAKMNRFVKADPKKGDYKEKVRQRCNDLVERAFCLKLNKAAKDHFVNQYVDQIQRTSMTRFEKSLFIHFNRLIFFTDSWERN